MPAAYSWKAGLESAQMVMARGPLLRACMDGQQQQQPRRVSGVQRTLEGGRYEDITIHYS